MGDPKGFLKTSRRTCEYRPVCERVLDHREVTLPRGEAESRDQASRCMDCGTPFCHSACPIGNYIPEWNDLVHRGRWEDAFRLLDDTNNIPEITGRLCPALCEYACVLGVNDDPVTIRENELAVVEKAFETGFVKAEAPVSRTGKRVAVVGSGPAGLACAAQLNRAGHLVTVFERDDRAGGILRYGIPDFKLEKRIIDRRLELWKKEGVIFSTGVDVGRDLAAESLTAEFDAVCLTGGSRVPRDLLIEGRDLDGIHFAMDYLAQSNRRNAGEETPADRVIDAGGKRVVVIGGGDTGADCVGTAHRQGAACVVQVEVLPRPPESRPEEQPWPAYPMLLRTSSSHDEGGERHWAVLTRRFLGEAGTVRALECVRVEFPEDATTGRPVMTEVPGSDFIIDADLVVLAVGFLHPEHDGLLADLGVELDNRGNVRTDEEYMTSREGVFAAGDMRRGQSLIVWAVSEGRRAAHHIDRYLSGTTALPAL